MTFQRGFAINCGETLGNGDDDLHSPCQDFFYCFTLKSGRHLFRPREISHAPRKRENGRTAKIRTLLTDWYLLQVVPPQVERLERGEVPDLDGEVGDLVAGGVQLHEGLHPADLLGEGDEPVIVHDEALEAGELTNRRG